MSNTINGFIQDIRDIFELEVPVDVEDLIYLLNGEVSFQSVNYPLIEKSDSGFKVIIDKNNLSPLELNFQLAHLVGHLFLHMGYLIDDEKWKETAIYEDTAACRIGHNVENFEANIFAEDLLIPAKELFEISKVNFDGTHYNSEKISQIFKVDQSSLKRKGVREGIYKEVWN